MGSNCLSLKIRGLEGGSLLLYGAFLKPQHLEKYSFFPTFADGKRMSMCFRCLNFHSFAKMQLLAKSTCLFLDSFYKSYNSFFELYNPFYEFYNSYYESTVETTLSQKR